MENASVTDHGKNPALNWTHPIWVMIMMTMDVSHLPVIHGVNLLENARESGKNPVMT